MTLHALSHLAGDRRSSTISMIGRSSLADTPRIPRVSEASSDDDDIDDGCCASPTSFLRRGSARATPAGTNATFRTGVVAFRSQEGDKERPDAMSTMST